MADRPIWSLLRIAFNAFVGETPRTQEEIDAYIDTQFAAYGITVTDDPTAIPTEYTRRRREWYDPFDLFDWLITNGIPTACVIVSINEGSFIVDRKYIAYITSNTP